MTKQELLENYTMEQLADNVIALEIAIADMKNTEKIIKQYNSKQCDCEKVEIIIKCPDCGKTNKFELDEKSSQLIQNKLTDKVNCLNNESRKLYGEIYDLKQQLQRKETAINQIDSIICELFGIAHNSDEYTDEFKELLRSQSEAEKTIADFLPTEPIKVADMLINEMEKRKKNDAKVHRKEQEERGFAFVNPFDENKKRAISELRQIAEHLLVYCNENGEREK